MRGDEPVKKKRALQQGMAFPTCVGMNRDETGILVAGIGVPHVRGDEPLAAESQSGDLKRSPRAWG